MPKYKFFTEREPLEIHDMELDDDFTANQIASEMLMHEGYTQVSVFKMDANDMATIIGIWPEEVE